MRLPIRRPFPPMEATLVETIPSGKEWLYEPKWDGFRCLVFRNGDQVYLQSKSGQSLARYFPELAESFKQLKARQFVLDGEIVVRVGEALSFNELLMRIHPAASRVRKLAEEHPATFIAFDILADEFGVSLLKRTLKERRTLLERFAERYFSKSSRVRLSPATEKISQARKWFDTTGSDLDGIIAKRMGEPYHSGDRIGMEKVKHVRTADCVIGGFRYASKKKVVGSLLLGLYDDQGLLHHVGFCSGLKAEQRKELLTTLEPLIEPPGFTGHAPGGPSRWSTKRSTEWQPLKPKLVVEVSYDHFTDGRFRHGTQLIRWRPDKSPKQCTMEQVDRQGRGMLDLLARSHQKLESHRFSQMKHR